MEEEAEKNDREISFSSALREKIGHHIYGELWAQNIKRFLQKQQLLDRPIHIISANLHSVMNSLYGMAALNPKKKGNSITTIAGELSNIQNEGLRSKVKQYALRNGMYQLDDTSGTNISVQIFDAKGINPAALASEIQFNETYIKKVQPIILVMDYAFGEQAYETMDELLKPYDFEEQKISLNIASISIMGKAGILGGQKGDIMIPNAHIFEGSADNYPFKNEFSKEEFKGFGLNIVTGAMITVLGTSLQNKDVLRLLFAIFLESHWARNGRRTLSESHTSSL